MVKVRSDRMNRRDFLAIVGAAALATIGSSMIHQAETASRAQRRFRVIDAHQHIFNSKLQGTGNIPLSWKQDGTIEHLIEQMDRGGVDKGFLITYSAEDIVSILRYRGYNPVELTPVMNHRYQVEAWKAHKDRFWWFTDGVNPIHETYLEDLERDFEMGASGVKLMPVLHGLLPDHPAWEPVYELCRKRRKPIIIDVSWWYFGKYPIFNEVRERRNLVKFQSFADYARLMDPVIEQFSDVPISLAHCGTARTWEDYEHIFSFIARHPNLSCDLAYVSASMSWSRPDRDYTPEFIRQLVKAVGARKVMYGSDSPYWFKGKDDYLAGRNRWTVIADECNFLSDEEKQLILAGNADRFVKYELP